MSLLLLISLAVSTLLLSALCRRRAHRFRPGASPEPQYFVPQRKAPPPEEHTRPRRSHAKPPWVFDAIIDLAALSPQCGCRALAHLFNRTYHDTGVSIGKTRVSEVLREYRLSLASPNRYHHTIATACPIRIVWGIDMTGFANDSGLVRTLFGIIDHGSRAVLSLQMLRERSSIALLRILLDTIERHGKPVKIRTDNEAVFTSWTFAFALHWLGIRHERTPLHCPWVNGRIERVWSTFKQVLRLCRIPNDEELQATLDLLRHTYNVHRPHQALSGHTPAEAEQILRDPKRRRERAARRR